MSEGNTRLDRHECLICGIPLVRIDGFPLCSQHEEEVKKKYFEGRKRGNFRKIFKNVRPMKFNIDGRRFNLREAKKKLA